MNQGDDQRASDAQELCQAELLASFDEHLKTADQSQVDAAPANLSTAALRDMNRAQNCLRLLEAVWPRQALNHSTIAGRLSGEAAAAGDPALPFQQFGRFIVQRELGRGGFGTVYLAHDPQLGRAVALKIPHSNVLSDKELRTRFHQEARAAAVLDHPNIVQVYEASEADGFAFMALAYCPGVTLADWLHGRHEPVPVADAAQLAATLAAAVHHAHERGIVHRDLKPANVILQIGDGRSPIDGPVAPAVARSERPSAMVDLRSAIPRITDFGLAKHMDAAATLTLTGTILGTPCYMAPEQAGANPNQAGPAADIYSLGAVLYELLTAQPPFHGDTPLETLHQVRNEDPVSPSRLRRSVPADLTTICLKCLEKEPAKRYPSAAALAEDLGRFLEGRPIQARPISRLGRATRWCRRKPVVATLLATLCVAVVVGFAGIFWQWQRAEDALDKSTRTAQDLKNERDRVVGERDRAERNLNRARNLVDRLTRLGNELSGKPGMDITARALLQQALVFHQEVLQEKSNDPAVRLEAARGYARVADIHHTLRQWDQAVGAYRDAIELFDGLHRENPENTSYHVGLARAHRFVAHVLRDSGKKDEARRSYDAAIKLEQQLVDAQPTSGNLRIALANTLLNSVHVLPAAEHELHEQRMRQAVRLQREALEAAPGNAFFLTELALGLSNVGWIHLRRHEFSSAETAFAESLQIRKRLHPANPPDREAERYLAGAYRNMAKILARTQRPEDAEEHYRETLKLLQALVDDFPTRPIVRIELAGTQTELGEFLNAATRLAEVEELLGQAIQHYEKLTKDHPAEPEHLRSLASAAFQLGQRCKTNKSYAAAIRAFERMLDANERLVAQFHEESDKINRAWDCTVLSDAHEQAGNLPAAERCLRQSRDHFRKLADEQPGQTELARKLATRGDQLIQLLRKSGKHAEGKEVIRSTAADWQKLFDTFNDDRDRAGLINGLLRAAESFRGDRQFDQAGRAYRDAVSRAPQSSRALNGLAWFLATCPDSKLQSPLEARELAERAAKLSPRDANILNSLGVACYRAKDYKGTLSALDQAIRVRGRGEAADWFFQAMAHWQLNEREAARRDFQKAVEWMRSNAAADAELLHFRAEAELLLQIPAAPQPLPP